MPNSKLYGPVKAADILAELRNTEGKPMSSGFLKTILRKIIVNLSVGDSDVVVLGGTVIQILEELGSDTEVRQLCYLYFSTVWKYTPEETGRAVEYMIGDYHRHKDERDEYNTCLVIRTLAGILVPEAVAAFGAILLDALAHFNPKVRATAAYSVARVFRLCQPELAMDLLKLLNELLRDADMEVVAAALAALGEITVKSGTMKLSIDSKHAQEICLDLKDCGEWSQVTLLDSVLFYVPRDHETAAKLIDTVLPYLQSGNSSIVLNTLKVIIYLRHYVSHVLDVFPTLPKSISAAVANLMLRPPEIQFLAMRNVILLLLGKPALLKDLDVTMFFCQYNDLLYIKDAKLEIIFLLASEDNVGLVLPELHQYALEIDVQMVRKAIRAIGNLTIKLQGSSEKCVSVLADLLGNSIPHVTMEVAIVARDILRKYPGQFDYIIDLLVARIDQITEPDSQASMIWIIGEYASSISDSETLLADYGEDFLDQPLQTQLTLLTAIMKAHVCQPYNRRLQQLVEQVLQLVIENVDNPDLRNRALFYYRILSLQIPNAIDVIKPKLPPITSETEALPSEVCEELDICIGTLASIYLRPVQQVFRHTVPRTFPDSPALVEEELK